MSLILISILTAIICVIYFVVLIYLLMKTFDENLYSLMGLILWLILGLSVAIYGVKVQTAKGPCLNYETRMHYNSATKTMMPMRVCTLRGEWIQETMENK